jgi:hypothetical protein
MKLSLLVLLLAAGIGQAADFFFPQMSGPKSGGKPRFFNRSLTVAAQFLFLPAACQYLV